MFSKLRKMMKKSKSINPPNAYPFVEEDKQPSTSLRQNIAWFKEVLHAPDDLIIREFANPDLAGTRGALLFFEGLVDVAIINNLILTSVMRDATLIQHFREDDLHMAISKLTQGVVPVGGVIACSTLNQALNALLGGLTLLFLDGQVTGFAFETRGWKERDVTEPEAERTVRGPRVGFVEKLNLNIGLIRRRGQNTGLVVKKMLMGKETKTEIALLYNQNTVVESTLEEVYRRLEKVKVNNLFDAGILEEAMTDSIYSVFPQFLYTERPDVVVACLLEGHIALMVDGSPATLVAPAPLALFFQSAEDYYERWHFGSLIRWTRYLCAFLSSSLPALYIAITSYHPELLPTNLAFSIGTARLSVPFPAFLEALVMEFVLEVLQEAGIRLPKPIGQTVSIVGGLVIGQSAVQAGIISPIMVIVIALTAISSFTLPVYEFNLATRLLRVPLIMSAVFLGFYGLVLAWLLVLVHLCSLSTMGVNYMEGLLPMGRSTLDTLLRAPLGLLNRK